jgi:hypothetical protein
MIVNKPGGPQQVTCHCPAKPYPHYHSDNQAPPPQPGASANTCTQPQALPVEQIHYPRLGAVGSVQQAANLQAAPSPQAQARGASPLPAHDQRLGSAATEQQAANGAHAQPTPSASGNSLNVAAGSANGGSSPSARRKLTPLEILTDCQRETEELEAHIDGLVKAGLLARSGRSNEYRELEERAMRIILRLDELDCTADARLRADRKRIVQLAQRVLEKLERSASTG